MNPEDDFSRGHFAGVAAGRVEADTARGVMVRQCCDALCSLATDAGFAARVHSAAASAFANLNGDFAATADAYQRVTETRQNLALAEARLAGARQLAEALGLIAKVTP